MMKKVFSFLLVFVALLSASMTALAFNFDITPFKETGIYDIEYDDMDDSVVILPKEKKLIFGFPDDGDGLLLAVPSVVMNETIPPCMTITILYKGENRIITDDVIIKPAETRYSFDVSEFRQTDTSGGNITETFILCLTDESIKMIEDIVDNDISSVKCRLSGKRNVDCTLSVDCETLKQMHTDYKESGALNNDFTIFDLTMPCTIK